LFMKDEIRQVRGDVRAGLRRHSDIYLLLCHIGIMA